MNPAIDRTNTTVRKTSPSPTLVADDPMRASNPPEIPPRIIASKTSLKSLPIAFLSCSTVLGFLIGWPKKGSLYSFGKVVSFCPM